MTRDDIRKYCRKKGIRFPFDGSREPERDEYQEGVNCSNPETVRLLIMMIFRGIRPNADFSDFECANMMFAIEDALRKEGVELPD